MNKIPFQDSPNTTTPVNASNLNLIQDNAESAIDKKIDFVKLLTVDDTAPDNCIEGDLYYNTLNELIYPATGTDTWSTVGTSPNEDCLYIDLEHHALYYYDGIDFTNYGAETTDNLSSDIMNPPSTDVVYNSINELNSEINSLKPTLLWTNQNPNNNFSASQITLSSGNYDFLEIYYYDWSGDTGSWKDLKCVKTLKGYATILEVIINYQSKAYIGARRIRYTNDTKLQVDTCYSSIAENVFISQATDAWCVPVKIYGYKYS